MIDNQRPSRIFNDLSEPFFGLPLEVPKYDDTAFR